MSRRMKIFLVVFAMVIFGLHTAQAREVRLDYTDGYSSVCDTTLAAGDIYSMKFTPQAPAQVLRMTFQAQGVGKFEVHLWQDKDGMPNVEKNLMTPFELEADDAKKYYTVDLADQGVMIDPPRVFHVGLVKKTEPEPGLCMDATVDWALRAKMFRGGEWIENEKDWILKVDVDYFNEPTQFYFTDITASAGLASVGGRIAWGDYDNDGDLDLLMSGDLLYRNNGDGMFTNVSAEAGVTGIGSGGMVWGDFDNDGFLDIFAMVGSMENFDRFLRNDGDGTFTDITSTALVEEDLDLNPSEGAAWGDYDKDGFLDLYLANYELPGETLGLGTRDRLYHNNGDGTFTDVAAALEIDPQAYSGDYMCGRGVNWGDFNDDRWPDIYVSNYRLDKNYLYMNGGDGTFTEVAAEKGVQGDGMNAAWGHTIGSAWGDFNNDGLLDLLAANLAHPQYISFSDMTYVYLNNGPPDYDFTDATAGYQWIYIETNSEPALGDWNNDGWLDVLVTNVYEHFFAQLYRNNGDGTLTDVTYFSGVTIENGWGAAFADYDGDGYLDIMSNQGLFRNNGNGNHWLKVRLECDEGDPFCVGARVEVQTAWDHGPQAREVAAGKGTANEDPFELHFGLNQCTEAWRVTAKFLNGKEVTLYLTPADGLLVINENDPSDEEPETPTQPGACADVDYSSPGWPDDDAADDAADDTAPEDDTGPSSDDVSDDESDDENNDDDGGSGCGC